MSHASRGGRAAFAFAFGAIALASAGCQADGPDRAATPEAAAADNPRVDPQIGQVRAAPDPPRWIANRSEADRPATPSRTTPADNFDLPRGAESVPATTLVGAIEPSSAAPDSLQVEPDVIEIPSLPSSDATMIPVSSTTPTATGPDTPTIAPPIEPAQPEPTPPPMPAAMPEPIAIEPAAPPDPSRVWDENLERLQRLTRERASDPTASKVWSARGPALDWLARSGDDAAGSDSWAAVIPALGASGGDGASRGRLIRTAVNALEGQAPLEVTQVHACRKVSGFSDFESIDPEMLRPGQVFLLYCELNGLQSREVDGLHRARLASRVELVAEGRSAPAWQADLSTEEDRCRRRRRDFFVSYRLTVPTDLAPGRYKLRLIQTDEVAGRTAVGTLAIAIRP